MRRSYQFIETPDSPAVVVAFNAITLLIFLCVALVRVPVLSVPLVVGRGGVMRGPVPASAPPLPASLPNWRVRPRPLPFLSLSRL